MKRHHRFWDWIAAFYSRQPVADVDSYQKKLQKTREHFTPASEVFEFGCGTGSTALNHAPYVKHILAIDVSARMIEIARGKAQAQGVSNVRFETGTIEDHKQENGKYDVVMAHSILHLLQHRDQVIGRVFHMLKPGGVFVSSTVCPADLFIMRIARFVIIALSWVGLLPYINHTSTENLVAAVKAAGFVIEYQWRPTAKAALFMIARKPREG